MSFAIPNQGGFGNAASTNPLTSSNFASTTGNMLVCAVRAGASTTITTVKNQAGVSFTVLAAQINGTQRVQFFYLKNTTGNATDNIVITFSVGNANNCAYFWEVSGANAVAPSDVATGGNATSGSTVTSAAFNTSAVDEIILAAAVTNATGTFSANAGYTLDSANGFGGFIGAQHLITSSLQSGITSAMTTTASPTLLGIAVASFRQAVTKGMIQSGNTVGSGAPTRTIPFGLNNQAGNMLVVTGRAGATAINLAVSDSQGNTWTILQSDAISAALQFIVAYAPNCKAGANTITIGTGNANNFTTCSMIAAEFAGPRPTSPVDVAGTVKTASASSTVTTNSITTTASDLVLLTSVNETTANPGYTPAGGFIQIQAGLNGLLAFNVPVAAGAIAPSSAIGTPVTWESYASSFFLGNNSNLLMMMGVGT